MWILEEVRLLIICFVIFAERNLPTTMLRLVDADWLDSELPNQKSAVCFWALEYGKFYGEEEDSVLCIKTVCRENSETANKVGMVGMVAAAQVTRDRSVEFIVENVNGVGQYERIILDPKMYSLNIHCRWIGQNHYSVANDGFFLPTVTAVKIEDGLESMSPGDIVIGFQYVKASMQKPNYVSKKPLSWLASEKMEKAGLFRDPYNLTLPSAKIFEHEFSYPQLDEWIKERVAEKKKGKKTKVADTHVVSKRNDGEGKEIVPYVESTSPKKRKAKSTDVLSEEEEGAALMVQENPLTKKAKKASTDVKMLKEPKVPRPSKKKIVEKHRSDRPASSACLDLFDAEETLDNDKPDENLVKKGVEQKKLMAPFYTWGERVFDIPVECIVSPPPTLVYRCLNKDHVNQIALSMVKLMDREPLVADLIPYKDGKLLHYEDTPEDTKDFEAAVRKKEIQFVAISGQHSALAAKWVITWSKKDANLRSQAKRLAFRRSLILSDRTPQTLLAQHSFISNEVNATMKYQSCFLDTVVHARRQWEKSGRPEKPVLGTNQRTRNVAFEVSLTSWFLGVHCFSLR